jgi:hypothetical protein
LPSLVVLRSFDSSCPLSSISFVIVLNLKILNGLQSFPGRICEKITGLPKQRKIEIAIKTINGENIIIPTEAIIMSNMRFIDLLSKDNYSLILIIRSFLDKIIHNFLSFS